MSIRASYADNCPGCHKRIGWTGRLVDRPQCVCGYVLDRIELEEEQRAFDRIVAPLRPLSEGASHAR